jgi:DNA polymerase
MGYETVHIPLVAAKVLQLRFSCLRITSAKAKVALMRVQDGRLRGLLAYGAAHTLRWGGRGVQVQNLPRPKETVPVWELIELYEAEGKLDPDVVSGILKRYGEKIQQKYRDDGLDPPPIATLDDAASALIRGIFLPDEGCFFAAADYNAVELRGVAWLAGEEKLLDYFRKNVDVYSEVAFMTLGRYPKGKKDPIRQLFKVVTLGFIYQMSATALYVYGIANGIDWETSPVTPVQCIETLRTMFPKIAGVGTGKFTPDGKTELREGGIWSDLNRAALSAMKYGESRIPNGKARFEFVNGDLLMYLPSGRPIRYRQARVEWAVPPWEVGKKEPRKKQQIVYRSPRGFWNRLHGGVFCENLTQATCRDFLAEAMVRVEKAGLQVALHVHDEIVASVRNDAYAWLMLHLMTINPDWATDFPLMAEMDTMPRYAKTPPSKKWLSINAENGEYKS